MGHARGQGEKGLRLGCEGYQLGLQAWASHSQLVSVMGQAGLVQILCQCCKRCSCQPILGMIFRSAGYFVEIYNG